MNSYVFSPQDPVKRLKVDLVGGKCLQLYRMSQFQGKIPDWFCITTVAFQQFLDDNHITYPEKPDPVSLQELRHQILASPFPNDVRTTILSSYASLLTTSIAKIVAVRSSATVEDAVTNAFAGQFDTFLGIHEENEVLEKVKLCWISLWGDRAIRYTSRIPIASSPKMAVIVQDFIPADVSGVMFTVHPVTRRLNEMLIESTWGLGELLVGGKIVPDSFVVTIESAEGTLKSIQTRKGSKRKALVWNWNENKLCEMHNPNTQNDVSLSDADIKELTRIGIAIASALGGPQDIEWAKYQDKIFILQSRPITTL